MNARELSSTGSSDSDVYSDGQTNSSLTIDSGAHDDHCHHSHAHTSILFAFASILLGVVFKNWTPQLKFVKFPFTAILFAFWALMSMLQFHFGLGKSE